jgi:hypothetical protein
LEVQAVCRARLLAEARAGRRRPARMAMMAMTTSNSIRVKARRYGPLDPRLGWTVADVMDNDGFTGEG